MCITHTFSWLSRWVIISEKVIHIFSKKVYTTYTHRRLMNSKKSIKKKKGLSFWIKGLFRGNKQFKEEPMHYFLWNRIAISVRLSLEWTGNLGNNKNVRGKCKWVFWCGRSVLKSYRMSFLLSSSTHGFDHCSQGSKSRISCSWHLTNMFEKE